MTSQIFSGPCCDSDVEPGQYKSFVWESHVRQQNFVIFEDFSLTLYILKLVKSNWWSVINAAF